MIRPDDIRDALDRLDALLPLDADPAAIEDAVIKALDAIIAPKDPLRELASDVAIRVAVRGIGRIVRRRANNKREQA